MEISDMALKIISKHSHLLFVVSFIIFANVLIRFKSNNLKNLFMRTKTIIAAFMALFFAVGVYAQDDHRGDPRPIHKPIHHRRHHKKPPPPRHDDHHDDHR